MKHQYFGDVNDYRKYALLRVLCGGGELSLGVCWMLTPPDGRRDGRRLGYLDDPAWRRHDPPLYDFLRRAVRAGRRDVGAIERSRLLPRTAYFSALLPDDEPGRRRYFQLLRGRLGGRDLVFFDPDNGLEVASVPRGRRGSSKYLYWTELEATWAAGHSVLLYQHFPRTPRAPFIARITAELRARTGAELVAAFRTPWVAFLLAAQPRHAARLERRKNRDSRLFSLEGVEPVGART